MAAADAPGETDAAYRPHDAYLCLMADALVRRVAALNVDFVLLGEDNVDSAQSNELDWVLQLLGRGGSLSCDSGRDDDPVAGEGNDPKDAFDAHGLGAVPWLWVTGNHDVLVQGNVVVNDELRAGALGSRADLGTRDWSLSGGPVVQGDVPADPRRALLSDVEMMRRVAADGDGHGLAARASEGLANYTWDVPGTALRFVVLDTAARSGGSSGVLKRATLDGFLKGALDQAKAEGKWVLLASHHAAASLNDGSDTFGTRQADAVTPAELTALVTSYDNVLFSFVGHSHRHHVRTLDGPHPVVELGTSSVADFPHQARLVELWDEDDGWLRLRATSIDVPAEGALLTEARRLAIIDWTTRWFDSAPTTATDRNVDIWVPRPR